MTASVACHEAWSYSASSRPRAVIASSSGRRLSSRCSVDHDGCCAHAMWEIPFAAREATIAVAESAVRRPGAIPAQSVMRLSLLLLLLRLRRLDPPLALPHRPDRHGVPTAERVLILKPLNQRR